jgi:hypothetical protein
LGTDNAALALFHYLHKPLSQIRETEEEHYFLEPVRGMDPEFIAFVRDHYGRAFVRAEELDQEDIELGSLQKQYQALGLDRYRRTFKVRDSYSGQIVAAAIANRAPLGINFSYLENRAYYLLDRGLKAADRRQVLEVIDAGLKPIYRDLVLQCIPVVTDAVTSSVMVLQRAFFIKACMQSIWLRAGFPQWYQHIHSFLQKKACRKRA